MWRIKPDKIEELRSEFKKRGGYGTSNIAAITDIPLPSLERMLKGQWFRSAANLARLFKPLVVEEQGEQSPSAVSDRVNVLIEKYCEYKTAPQNSDGNSLPSLSPASPIISTNILTSSPFFPMEACMEGIAQAKQVCFLSTWLVLSDSLLQPLVDRAIQDAVETRILVLDPASPHVAHRARDLNSSRLASMGNADRIEAAEAAAQAEVYANIMTSLESISNRASHHPNSNHLEVGVYDSTPVMTLLIMDGYVCQGTLRRDHMGSSLPHILYTREQNPALYQADINHFNAIWNSRTTYRYDIAKREADRSASLAQVSRAANKG